MDDNELTWVYLEKKFLRICHKWYIENKRKVDSILTIFFAGSVILLTVFGLLEAAVGFMAFVMFKLLMLSMQIALLAMFGLLAALFLALAALIVIFIVSGGISILKEIVGIAKNNYSR